MHDELAMKRAEKLLSEGLDYVSHGEFERARDAFCQSQKWNPSAEALTYHGWMEHHLGNTEKAITLCHQAIDLDPAFGNPYNDIGSYLMAKGEDEKAIAWFIKATKAPRYEPRQFPHMNLARIFIQRKQYHRALQEYEKAHQYAPEDPEILASIESLRRVLN